MKPRNALAVVALGLTSSACTSPGSGESPGRSTVGALREGVVARARWIGAHLEAQNKPRELRTHAELHPDLQEFMHASGASLNEVPVLLQLVVARRARAQQRRLAT